MAFDPTTTSNPLTAENLKRMSGELENTHTGRNFRSAQRLLRALRGVSEEKVASPLLASALLGAGAGALGAGEGSRLQGALAGGALGAGLKAGGGKLLKSRGAQQVAKKAPKPRPGSEQALPSVILNPRGAARAAPTPPPRGGDTLMLAPSSTAKTQVGYPTAGLPTTGLPTAGLPTAGLPPQLQQELAGSPLVQAGVPPAMAAQLARMSARRGEDAVAAVSRHAKMGVPSSAGGVHSMVSKAASVHFMRLELEKAGMMPGAGSFAQQAGKGLQSATKKLQKAQSIGVPKMQAPSVKPPNIKVAFSESQYSGGTGGPGIQNYASYIPPFRVPPIAKTSGPPSESEESRTKKHAAMREELAKLNAVSSPKAQLSKAQKVGKSKMTTPGPSVQQVAKPQGFGRALPGASKPEQGV